MTHFLSRKTHVRPQLVDRHCMKSRQRTSRARKLSKKTATATIESDEMIDLSDVETLTSSEISDRQDELAKLEKKIDRLRKDESALRSELGLDRVEGSVAIDDSALFFDETADVFESSERVQHYEALAQSLETEDVEFDERFAVFVSTDTEGDHKARRWLDQS